MFRLFKGTPSGTYKIAVSENPTLLIYAYPKGEVPTIVENLYLSALYVAKALYVVRHPEFTDLTLGIIGNLMTRFHETGNHDLLSEYSWSYTRDAFTPATTQINMDYWLNKGKSGQPLMNVALASVNPKHLSISVAAIIQSHVLRFHVDENAGRNLLLFAFWDSFLGYYTQLGRSYLEMESLTAAPAYALTQATSAIAG